MPICFVDDLDFPSDVQSQPLAELGGPVFDETGHVVAVVGPPGDMSGAWHYSPDGTSKTWDRPTAAPQQAIGAWWVIRDIKFVGAADWGSCDSLLASHIWVWNTSGCLRKRHEGLASRRPAH